MTFDLTSHWIVNNIFLRANPPAARRHHFHCSIIKTEITTFLEKKIDMAQFQDEFDIVVAGVGGTIIDYR